MNDQLENADVAQHRATMDVDGVLETVAEMAQITADFARDTDEDARTRIGAAQATASILAKVPPILNMRAEIVAQERRYTARILANQGEDPSDPFARIRRVEAIETLQRHNARLPQQDADDDDDDVLG